MRIDVQHSFSQIDRYAYPSFQRFQVIGSNGLLHDKTRVLVTNALQYLPQSNHILAIKDGRIAEQGSYDELMNKEDGEFGHFVRTFGEKKRKKKSVKDGDGVKK